MILNYEMVKWWDQSQTDFKIHVKEFGLYPESNVVTLKDFKQGEICILEYWPWQKWIVMIFKMQCVLNSVLLSGGKKIKFTFSLKN